MVTQHYGTDEIIRQCITPGDYVQHDGRTYIASMNDISKNRLFIRSMMETKCITDHTVKVYLDCHGLPVKASNW